MERVLLTWGLLGRENELTNVSHLPKCLMMHRDPSVNPGCTAAVGGVAISWSCGDLVLWSEWKGEALRLLFSGCSLLSRGRAGSSSSFPAEHGPIFDRDPMERPSLKPGRIEWKKWRDYCQRSVVSPLNLILLWPRLSLVCNLFILS